MIIDRNSKVGAVFSAELLEQEKKDINSETINHIIDIHNNFVAQVKQGKYTKKEFTSFRGKIATELIINSKIILKLCDLFLEDDEIVFNELVTLCDKNFINISETNRINFIASGIREINRKLKSFVVLYFDSVVTISESKRQTLSNYLEHINKLEDVTSDEYKHFIDSYHDFINRTFTSDEFKRVLIESDNLEYINLLNYFKAKIGNLKSSLESNDCSHLNDQVLKMKNRQALRQLRKNR